MFAGSLEKSVAGFLTPGEHLLGVVMAQAEILPQALQRAHAAA
jgi:hypothetical protein